MRDFTLKFKPPTEEPEEGVVLLFFLADIWSDALRGEYNGTKEDYSFISYGGTGHKKEEIACWAYAPLYDEVVE